MQAFDLEDATASARVTTTNKGVRIIIAILAVVGVVAIMFGVHVYFAHAAHPHNRGLGSGGFHAYKSMAFYLRTEEAVYLGTKCVKSGTIFPLPSIDGWAGPFGLGNSNMDWHVCAEDGTDLGALKVHHDPCDSLGRPATAGISDIGNCCFLNAAMQLVFGIPAICSAIFDERNVQDPTHSPLPALRAFADAYRNTSSAVASEHVIEFRRKLHKLEVVDGMSGQEDSGEALARLFKLYNFPEDSPFLSILSNYASFKRESVEESDSCKHKEEAATSSGKKTKEDVVSATCGEEDCRTECQTKPIVLVPLSLSETPQDPIDFDSLYDLNFRRELVKSELCVHISKASAQAVSEFENVDELVAAQELLFNIQIEGDDPILEVPETWRGMRLVGLTQPLGGDDQGRHMAYKRRCLSSDISAPQWIRYEDARIDDLQDTAAALTAASNAKLLFFMRDPELPACIDATV